MAIVLITGGSGLIGQALTRALRADDHEVRWLTRRPEGPFQFRWDPMRGQVDPAALDNVEHIVHLAGAGIADKRWSKARIEELIHSRAGSARLLLRFAQQKGIPLKSFVSAAGIGYYGAVTGDHLFTEKDPPGTDTIARISMEWERAAEEWNRLCRMVKLRTPMVLAREGGALPRLAALARWGLAAPLGTGRQWMPWVHIDDLMRIYMQALFQEDMSDAYNVSAPGQPTNKEFMRALAQALKRPFFLPSVPAFALHLGVGELASVLLGGSRASNEKLLATGFRFEHEKLDEALGDLFQ